MPGMTARDDDDELGNQESGAPAGALATLFRLIKHALEPPIENSRLNGRWSESNSRVRSIVWASPLWRVRIY